MAVDPNRLSVLAYARGFTLWHYRAPGRARELARPGFFDPASELLRSGDLIIATLETGDTAIVTVARRTATKVAIDTVAASSQSPPNARRSEAGP